MTTNVLILCTHNSARSVLAEAMLNHLARRRGVELRGYSAGSAPRGRVHPLALETLRRAGIDSAGLRSKSWDEFAGNDAPRLRAVITVCDSAARESCPLWPGTPVQVHWGYADPSLASDDESLRSAFELTRLALGYRLLQLVELPFGALDDAALREQLIEIARS